MTDADDHGYVDFLSLANADLEGVRLIVLAGDSGTGKSSALRFLANEHPHLAGRPRRWMRPALGDVEVGETRGHLVLLDEIDQSWQLRLVRDLLRADNVVAVASHVPIVRFTWLRLRYRVRAFSTDRDDGKLAGVLRHRGVPFDPADVRRFVARFGANVVDLGCILERSPGRPFGQALAHFERFCALQRVRENDSP